MGSVRRLLLAAAGLVGEVAATATCGAGGMAGPPPLRESHCEEGDAGALLSIRRNTAAAVSEDGRRAGGWCRGYPRLAKTYAGTWFFMSKSMVKTGTDTDHSVSTPVAHFLNRTDESNSPDPKGRYLILSVYSPNPKLQDSWVCSFDTPAILVCTDGGGTLHAQYFLDICPFTCQVLSLAGFQEGAAVLGFSLRPLVGYGVLTLPRSSSSPASEADVVSTGCGAYPKMNGLVYNLTIYELNRRSTDGSAVGSYNSYSMPLEFFGQTNAVTGLPDESGQFVQADTSNGGLYFLCVFMRAAPAMDGGIALFCTDETWGTFFLALTVVPNKTTCAPDMITTVISYGYRLLPNGISESVAGFGITDDMPKIETFPSLNGSSQAVAGHEFRKPAAGEVVSQDSRWTWFGQLDADGKPDANGRLVQLRKASDTGSTYSCCVWASNVLLRCTRSDGGGRQYESMLLDAVGLKVDNSSGWGAAGSVGLVADAENKS